MEGGEIARHDEFGIAFGKSAVDAHVVIAHGFAAAAVGVEKRFRLVIDAVVVKAEQAERRLSLAGQARILFGCDGFGGYGHKDKFSLLVNG